MKKNQIFVCGDIVSQNQNIKIDKKLQNIIASSALNICNLEAPVIDQNFSPSAKAGPILFNHPEIIETLSNLGFNLFCLANNHICDYGERGLQKTIDQIENLKNHSIGARTSKTKDMETFFTEIDGTKIAILNGGENQFGALDSGNHFLGIKFGYTHCFSNDFYEKIQEIKGGGDLVICITHSGLEGVDVPLPQFREAYKSMCRMGADIVINHHPHWAQGYESFICDGRECYIFYSLGNFYFNRREHTNSPRDTHSYSLLLEIKNKKIRSFQPIFHKTENGIVSIERESDSSFSLEALNQKLQNPSYSQEIKQIVNKNFSIYLQYYHSIFFNISGDRTLIQNLKTLIKKILYKKQISQDALLLHNLQIETHRFLQELALKEKILIHESKKCN